LDINDSVSGKSCGDGQADPFDIETSTRRRYPRELWRYMFVNGSGFYGAGAHFFDRL
jgi:hypothetical protein